jgi:DMSO/TMAO reductase YedYZ heme-binding membrane subunit
MIEFFIIATGLTAYLCMLFAIIAINPKVRKFFKINVKIHMILGLSAFIFASLHVCIIIVSR